MAEDFLKPNMRDITMIKVRFLILFDRFNGIGIIAQFKKDAILTATEATAIAITDTSKEASTNMEQHIKNLINEAFKKHAATSSKKNKK